jgi:hypothetical protein
VTAPDYRRIAIQAVGLLCSVGCYGLDPSKQRQLWQRALDLDRELHPHRVASIVWTETEGDIDPPRRADGTPVPAVSTDGRGLVAATATEAATGDGHAEHKHEFPPGIDGSCECGKSYTAARVDEALGKYVTERAGRFVTAALRAQAPAFRPGIARARTGSR